MNYLQVVETERLRIEWRAPHPCSVTVTARGSATDAADTGSVAEPLREETTYGLFVRARGAPWRVEVWHKDPTVTRGLQVSADGTTCHGTIATRSQVGELRLQLSVDGSADAELVAQVLPMKVGPATVEQMRDEVDSQIAGLSLRYLKATSTQVDATRTRLAKGVGWLRLIEYSLDRLEPALASIARNPHRDQSSQSRLIRTASIRRIDTNVIRTVGRLGGEPLASPLTVAGQRIPIPDRLLARRSAKTLDTPEHRWLRHELDLVKARLRTMVTAMGSSRSHRDHAVYLAALEQAMSRVDALLRLPALVEAASERPATPTLRLRTAQHYRSAYHAVRLFQFGLDLGAGRIRVGLTDLAVLYEQWCFLSVAAMLADASTTPVDLRQLIASDASGLFVRLRRGQRQALRFDLANGAVGRLAYQPRFGRPALLTQQPDMLLSLERDGVPYRRIVLDAKYRRDDRTTTLRRYGLPAPPSDALADLHRYRDAIRDSAGARIVDEAVALYPLETDDTDRVMGSPLWKSIEALGVGAVPCLPQTKQHLRAFLHEVLSL